jgi:hypothetical protein
LNSSPTPIWVNQPHPQLMVAPKQPHLPVYSKADLNSEYTLIAHECNLTRPPSNIMESVLEWCGDVGVNDDVINARNGGIKNNQSLFHLETGFQSQSESE